MEDNNTVYVVVGMNEDDDYQIEVYDNVEQAQMAYKRFRQVFSGSRACLASRAVLKEFNVN